jgi:hypothetical protein
MTNWNLRNLCALLAFAGCDRGVDEEATHAKREVVETEVAVPVASLPTAVTAAVAGKGAISEAEVIVRPDGVIFEVEIGDTEYAIDPDGRIVAQETEHDEPGDDKD